MADFIDSEASESDVSKIIVCSSYQQDFIGLLQVFVTISIKTVEMEKQFKLFAKESSEIWQFSQLKAFDLPFITYCVYEAADMSGISFLHHNRTK